MKAKLVKESLNERFNFSGNNVDKKINELIKHLFDMIGPLVDSHDVDDDTMIKFINELEDIILMNKTKYGNTTDLILDKLKTSTLPMTHFWVDVYNFYDKLEGIDRTIANFKSV